MTNKMGKSAERIVFLDYIRVLACLAVMMAHASEHFYCVSGTEAMVANEQNRFWVALYDGCFSRAAVPLFMIVSAYLLVPMREGQTMTQFYRRRFMRIIPPLVCFLLLYTFLPLLWGGTTWEQALDDLRLLPFNFPMTAAHLWIMNGNPAQPLIPIGLATPAIALLTFLCCAITTKLLSFLPGSKYVIG